MFSFRAPLTLFAILAVGCGGHFGTAPSASKSTWAPATRTPDVLVKLRVQPEGDVVIDDALGAQFQIAVDGVLVNESRRQIKVDYTRKVTFSVDDPAVAKVSGSGLITPVGVGSTIVRASYDSADGSFAAVKPVTVVQASVRRPVFVALEVIPSQRTLWKVNPLAQSDDLQQMLVIATDAQGRTYDLTRSIGLRLQDGSGRATNIARVDPLGLLRGVAFGELIAVARINAFQLVTGAKIVCGVAPATPVDPNSLYSGAPLTGSNNAIDLAVLDGLQARGIEPAPLADDGEFLRRLYADAVGRSPSEAELSAFVASTASDKSSAEIDRLLALPEFDTYWAGQLGEWFTMPRKVLLKGSERANYDMSTNKAMVVRVNGQNQTLNFTPSMFGEPDKARVTEMVREINKQLTGARSFRFDQYVHIETAGAGVGTSLSVSGAVGTTLGLAGQSGTVFDTWAQGAIRGGSTLAEIFSEVIKGNVAPFETQHPSAADKVDVLLLAGTGHTARCAKCHDHPLTGPNDPTRWLQDERYPLDAFFATSPAEATKLDGKTNIRFDPPKEPGFVLDPTASVTTTLADPVAQRRAEFASVFTASEVFQRGVAHRLFAQVATPLLDPNQFLQKNVDAVMVPAVFDALGQAFLAEQTSLRGFLRVVFGSVSYQLTSCVDGLDTANDVFLQRRTLRMRFAEVFDHGVDDLTGRTASGADLNFIHQTFGYPFSRQTVSERLNVVNTSQALLLLNSPVVQDRITNTNAKVAALATQVSSGAITKTEAVQSLFRTALSREADADELLMYIDLIDLAPNVTEGLQDAAAATIGVVEFGVH
jgi:hypothetical protein